ncbi:MAG TPA: hypothetical protein EYN67_15940 [Flavobacteriales bacterium]|nr:hypothetical protein [Flavobacteriales bacterium]
MSEEIVFVNKDGTMKLIMNEERARYFFQRMGEGVLFSLCLIDGKEELGLDFFEIDRGEIT